MARWPKTGHWLCLWLSAQPFCRARPVRAPLAGECLRTCQALRKDARGQGRGGRKESASHKAFPFPAAANWPAKGKCFAQGLSLSGGSAMARERGVLRTSLSYPKAGPSAVKGLAILAFLSFPVPVAARFFAKHLAIGGALAFRWCAHGARTAKLLRTWPCAEHWLSGGLVA